MRKNMFMLLAAALLVVTGCRKDDNKANGGKMVFNAGIDNGGAKTEIDGFNMNWTQGDVVKINGGEFTADNGGAITTLSGSEVDKVEGLYKAYYPASISEGTLPSAQSYDGTKLSLVNPMYAESESTSLLFHNICALVKFELTGTGTVKTITATADKALCGTYTIVENNGNFYANVSGDAKSVTLNCGDGVSLPQTFYMALPQGEYNSLKFTASDGSNSVDVWTGSSKNLTAGMLYELDNVAAFSPVSPGPTPGETPTVLSGVFTLDLGAGGTKSYNFTRGNLWYDGSNFHFEENQEDFTPGDKSEGLDMSHVSYFCCANDLDGAFYHTNPVVDILFTENDGFKVDEETGFHALSIAEWEALLNRKSGYTPLYAYGTLNDVQGFMLFPDDWQISEYSSITYGRVNPDPFTRNEFTSAMTEDGAVFLPNSGRLFYDKLSSTDPSVIKYNENAGAYWPSDSDDGWVMEFNFTDSGGPWVTDFTLEYYGNSIRLVKEVSSK